MRRTSCYKITFRTSNRPVSHLPAVLEKASHESAERKIAPSGNSPLGSALGCSGSASLRTGRTGDTRPRLSDRRSHGRSIFTRDPALNGKYSPRPQAKLARLTFWRKSSPCISTTTHISCSRDRILSPMRSPRVSSRIETRDPVSVPKGPAFE